MVWPFKEKGKKEAEGEKIPELPELTELPELPGFSNAFNPVSDYSRKAEPEKIKDEIPPIIHPWTIEQSIKEPPAKMPHFKTMERARAVEITEEMPETIAEPRIKKEPVFVRIDKYQIALQNFQEIKKKAIEIENLLRDIKDIKAREEAELQNWEQEIRDAKEKLDKIDRTIFNKLEE
ncbi:MAG: hypothetical protein AABX71_00135 [Nanoarchaeota archaeon]